MWVSLLEHPIHVGSLLEPPIFGNFPLPLQGNLPKAKSRASRKWSMSSEPSLNHLELFCNVSTATALICHLILPSLPS